MLRRSKLSWTVRTLLLIAVGTASLALAWAQDSAVARVVEMTGRVSILRDSAEWALNLGNAVQPRQLIVTGADGYAKFQLTDGSTFEVFQNSKVVFRANPPSWGDLLDVVIGRVKVFIQHRNGPNPNRVTTQTAVISVRGTVFDVAVEDEDATTLVSVDEGVVGVRHSILGGNETQLQSGESVRVFKNQPLARRMDKGSVAQNALRAAAQAVYDVMLARSASGVGTTGGPSGTPPGGGTGGQGDKNPKNGGNNTGDGGSASPPPPPPPPPPASGSH